MYVKEKAAAEQARSQVIKDAKDCQDKQKGCSRQIITEYTHNMNYRVNASLVRSARPEMTCLRSV